METGFTSGAYGPRAPDSKNKREMPDKAALRTIG